MGNRYSDIRKAGQLQAALQNYITYISTPRTPNLNSQGARNNTQVVYLAPFTVTVALDEVVMAKVNPDHFAKLSAPINASGGSEVLAAIGAKSLIDLGKFSPARLVLFENATRSVSVATSDVTGLQYLKYAGERFSCPFGAKAATDDLIDAYQDAKAAVLAAGTTANADVKRVSLVREKVAT